MKVLYAIQGTGNGHIGRAREIVPILMKYADVDVLLSGTQADIRPQFPVRYKNTE
jgi:predicted glycosyltransferase